MSETQRAAEPIAAERITGTGMTCMYDCERHADWIVELEDGISFVCCQTCSRQNRIYARENDLYKTDVSPEVMDHVE
jgi:hypothetical protein